MNNFVKPGKIVTFTAPSGGVVSGGRVSHRRAARDRHEHGRGDPSVRGGRRGHLRVAEGHWIRMDGRRSAVLGRHRQGCHGDIDEQHPDRLRRHAAAALSGDTTGHVRLPGIVDPGGFVDVGEGVQDIVLGTTAPDGVSSHLFVSTTGTVTGAVPNGRYAGQPRRRQSVRRREYAESAR